MLGQGVALAGDLRAGSRKSDRGLLWFNGLFLFWLAFIPFPTALLGDYPKERIAVIRYGAVTLLAGLSFSWMRYYAFFVGRLTYTDYRSGSPEAGDDQEHI
jgi:hypothetical protein